jgi:hypothetical protein
MMRIVKLLLGVSLGLYCCLLSSCDLGLDQVSSLSTLHQVVLTDTSPATLTASVAIAENQNARDGKVSISIQFADSAIRNPNDVQFLNQESIVCNNVPLVYDVASYSYIASIISTSNDYTCLYTSHGHGSTLAIPIQTQLSPTYVLSGTNLEVNYNPNDKVACSVQVAASDNLQTDDGPVHADDGLYTTLDVGNLNGSGSLRFTRTCNSALPSAFHSVTVNYQATRSINVTWKSA